MSWQAGSTASWWRAPRSPGCCWYERRRPPSKLVALVAALAALAVAGARAVRARSRTCRRRPTSCCCPATRSGRRPGSWSARSAALASNVFLGQGPWTPWQMLGWGAAGRRRRRCSRRSPAGGSAAGRWRSCAPRAGFAFGAWMDLFTLMTFAAERSARRLPRDRRRLAAVQHRARDRQRRALPRVRPGVRAHAGALPPPAATCAGMPLERRPAGAGACARSRRAARRCRARRRAIAARAARRPTALRYLERAQNARRRLRRRARPAVEPADHRLDGARARGRRAPSARRAPRRADADRLHARAASAR